MTLAALATALVLAAGPDAQGAAGSAAPAAPTAAASPTATAIPVAEPTPAPAPRASPTPAVTALPPAPANGPDIELHVPRAEVEKLSLDVENLQARLDVDTSVARLVTIRAGVVATVQKLKAELDGVSAETHLVVRLNRVAEVLERALAAIDKQPQLAGGPVASAAPVPAAVTPVAAAVGVDAAAEPRPSSSKPSTE